MTRPLPDASIIVPIFNELGNIERLVDEIAMAMANVPQVTYEVVLVDDGSTDGSRGLLARLAQARPEVVRVVELRRNYGQTAALDAGLRVARGEVFVAMDGDAQNDPRDVPRLLEAIADGADVVSGWRRDRKDPFLTRRLPSILANRLIALCTGVAIRDFGCTLKAYRRGVMCDVRLYGEMHRFMPAYAQWQGAKVVEIPVNHRARDWGHSKYGLRRTLKVMLDLLTVLFLQSPYVAKPLHVFGAAGCALMAFAVGLAAVAVTQKLAYPVVDPRHVFVHRNPLASLATLLFILGSGAISLGLVAELLARVYHVTAGPPYAVAGWRNVAGKATPEEQRALPSAIAALAGGEGALPRPEDGLAAWRTAMSKKYDVPWRSGPGA